MLKGIFGMATERSKFSADDNYPDFSEHNNHMSQCLSKKIYSKLHNKTTPNGFSLDNAIQTGVDNPGSFILLFLGSDNGPTMIKIIQD